MPAKLPSCEFRVVTPTGQLNVCRAGLYGGKVTDGMCRLCAARGDKPAAIISIPRFDLGQLVERTLTGVGVTKELVSQITRKKDCGCAKRQQWLTQWGYRQQERLEVSLNKIARWYGIT